MGFMFFGGYGGGCGYGYGGGCGYGGGSGFALIIVLFILLVIIGCVCWGGSGRC
nr:YjcZ family sporulation protein [Priestia megaterium]MDH3183752.1 YjcZ family sporulation protein [Priestia megaterium]